MQPGKRISGFLIKEKGMPNYEIVKKFCKFRKIEAVMPAIYVSEAGGSGKLMRYINDCLSKNTQCKGLGCKYTGESKDPFEE